MCNTYYVGHATILAVVLAKCIWNYIFVIVFMIRISRRKLNINIILYVLHAPVALLSATRSYNFCSTFSAKFAHYAFSRTSYHNFSRLIRFATKSTSYSHLTLHFYFAYFGSLPKWFSQRLGASCRSNFIPKIWLCAIFRETNIYFFDSFIGTAYSFSYLGDTTFCR